MLPRTLARLIAQAVLAFAALSPSVAQVPADWRSEWPHTDFSARTIDLSTIRSGGPPRDGIPSIDAPRIVPVQSADHVGAEEPVISLSVNGAARAYPIAILMWHEIVNDTLGGTPLAVTYCPLCNAALVFDRTLSNRVLEFGTTGKLRHSDLVMYDRQTESWWQQFTGKAIVGDLTGAELLTVPSRVEPFSAFVARHPEGTVLARRKMPADPMGEIHTPGTIRRTGPSCTTAPTTARCRRFRMSWQWATRPGPCQPCDGKVVLLPATS